jgi:hypothetical protein
MVGPIAFFPFKSGDGDFRGWLEGSPRNGYYRYTRICIVKLC